MPSEDAIGEKLELMSRLLAISLVNGKSQREQIRLLSIAGMRPTAIAELLGTTANTVNVGLSALRKGGKLKLKSEGGAEDV